MRVTRVSPCARIFPYWNALDPETYNEDRHNADVDIQGDELYGWQVITFVEKLPVTRRLLYSITGGLTFFFALE